MRALVLLCLLHAAFGQFSWRGPAAETPQPESDQSQVCVADRESCGCCLMQQQISRLKKFFNLSTDALKQELMSSQMTLNNMRGSRSAFSVALSNDKIKKCIGPFSSDKLIVYSHIFINLGDGYNVQTGIFTVPRSGVYSLSVTIYGAGSQCAALQVNGQNAAELLDKNGQDTEDSSTVVVAIALAAGDQVSVKLLRDCIICDDMSHYNTFTGFLLYASKKV